MAERKYAHDINLLRVGQLRDFRVQNLTTTQRNALASVLTGEHDGLHVWDITEKMQYYWNGTAFVHGVPATGGTVGGMVYKGAYTSLTTTPPSPEIGHTYVYTGTEGTLTWAGQTFLPDAIIEPQDLLIYRGDNTWDIIEGDKNYATTTTAGSVRLASDSVTIEGTNTTDAVTPSSLQAFVTSRSFASVFFANGVATLPLIPLTIEHNLALQHRDSFVISVKDSDSNEMSVDVTSVDQNSINITTSVAFTGLKVTIIGF